MFDMNDAELPRGSEIIPDGSYAKVIMHIRRGGTDGHGEADRGLLKPSKSPGSDVLSLDCEFTVLAGPHAKRKFWQSFTVVGGKLDEQGVSIGWKISKGLFRAMIDSALALNPQDMSEAAKAKRMLRGLSDLHGITFAAKIRVEAASDPRYGDSNRLDRVVLPGEPEYARIMAGEALLPQPSNRPARTAAPATPAAWAPGAPAASAWAPEGPATRTATAPRQWDSPGATSPAQAALPPAAPSSPAPALGGPSWLNG
jgi:hypothetical protein